MTKILIIEDDPLMMETLKGVLEINGFEVLSASNGEQGLSAFYDEPTPLIITDLIMPKKGGLRVIAELKEENPQLKIIAISGGGSREADEYLNASKTLNVDIALKKPFKNEELLSAINKLLA